MFGVGFAEVLIIVVIAIVVFGGPAVIGFWLGYKAGRKSGDAPREDGRDADAGSGGVPGAAEGDDELE